MFQLSSPRKRIRGEPDASALPMTKRLRFASAELDQVTGNIYTVRAGESTKGKAKDFHVHESIIRKSSPFFENALNGEWIEGQTKVVELPKVESEVFNIYVQWIYRGIILSKADDNTETKNEDGSTVFLELNRLHVAMVMGDMLQDEDFQDAVLDARLQSMEGQSHFDLDLVFDLYKLSSSDKSPLRKLAIDYLITRIESKNGLLLRRIKDSNSDISMEIIIKVIDMIGQKSTFHDHKKDFTSRREKCEYHLHKVSGKPCYREKWRLGNA